MGGHCKCRPILFKLLCKKIGLKTILINAGRKINDNMSEFVSQNLIKHLGNNRKKF